MRLLYIRQQRHEVRLSSLIKALVAAMAQHGEMRVQLLTNNETEDSLRSACDTAYTPWCSSCCIASKGYLMSPPTVLRNRGTSSLAIL